MFNTALSQNAPKNGKFALRADTTFYAALVVMLVGDMMMGADMKVFKDRSQGSDSC